MSTEPAKHTPKPSARTKPCPDERKGTMCGICGGRFVCLQSWRPKRAAIKKATGEAA